MLSETRSWVFGANDSALGRGLNHLPFTAFVDAGVRRLGVGIGACVLDLRAAVEALPGEFDPALAEGTLNAFMARGPAAWAALRERMQFLLGVGNKDRPAMEACLLDLRGVELALPATVGDYTDFYASRNHALRVGQMFRPEKPLLDNYDWMPIGYHGRSSSIVASGTPVRRPWGQRAGGVFAPTAKLDFELELGFYVGVGNELGEPIPLSHAGQHLFGVSLLNDWSARDTQAWEYQPLGPFLGKNFCTSVSPWITPMAALEPFRVGSGGGRVDYLRDADDAARGGYAVECEVRVGGQVISWANARELLWTPAQMVAHHTVGGCNLRPGDLLGTGTISGAERAEAGCLLELTSNGTEPLHLGNGRELAFLEDGDEVTFSAFAQAGEAMPVRLGECRGTVLAARSR